MRLLPTIAIVALALASASPAVAEQTNDASPLSSHQIEEIGALTDAWSTEIAGQSTVPGPLTVQQAVADIPSPQSPERIHRWIRDHIDYEPYTGALRGANGALIAGQANAGDIALLSHAMLKEAGHQPRFVTGRLYESDANQILDDALGRANLADRGGNRFDARDRTVSPHRADIIGDLLNHIWVEVEVGDHYRALDPLASPSFGVTPATDSSPTPEFPDHRLPTMTMTLVSHLEDGRQLEHLVVDGPAKRLAFRTMTLGFLPHRSGEHTVQPILQLGEQRLDGDALPIGSLEQLELQFRYRSNHHENRWRQVLYRHDQGDDLFEADHQHVAIAIAPGLTSAAFVAHSSREASVAALNSVDDWLRAETDGQAEPLSDADRRRYINAILHNLGASLPLALAHFLDRSTQALAHQFGVLTIIDRPRVFTAATVRRGHQFDVDLQIDGERLSAMPRQGIPHLATSSFLGLQGILRDAMINTILSAYGDHRDTTVRQIFEHLSDQQLPLTTVDASSLDQVDDFPVGSATADQLRRQVRDRDMILLTPTSMVDVDGIDRFGWWAFSPHNGNIEGHTSDALATLDDGGEPSSRGTYPLFRSHLQLISRHYGATAHAIDEERRFPELICQARDTMAELTRRVCADGQPLETPNVVQCLTNPPSVQPDLFNPQRVSCTDRMAASRCAAALATTVLGGDLRVDHDHPSSDVHCP